MSEIADALDYAHAAGLIHRDVKPQNILIENAASRRIAYLADFGVTKTVGGRNLTRTGQTLGTLDYISPEQIRAEEATPQSDIYSAAAVATGARLERCRFRDADAAVPRRASQRAARFGVERGAANVPGRDLSACPIKGAEPSPRGCLGIRPRAGGDCSVSRASHGEFESSRRAARPLRRDDL